ncbi:pilus assembly protein PilP [Gilvimarinus sp. F26214L]|uniref:pilus assembly protein PilP n=1 Tax=Gilvimarinus sp. DZF01 TaxID=3461371 RepID=UPI004046359D
MKVVSLFPAVALALLTACSSGKSQQDLVDFINETKRRPAGQIEPMPTFAAYQAYEYSASRLRNPFERPVPEQQRILVNGGSDVKPDFDRPRELLEEFAFASLTMVGTFEQNGTLWALIDDGAGQVHPVKEGNFLGKNHGKIVEAGRTHLNVVEIVTDGLDGWIERPRTLKLREKE